MRKYLRTFLILLASLLLVSWVVPAINFQKGPETFLKAALFLTVANFFIKPVVNLLLLPVNLLTLGLFRWVVNVFVFYLMIMLIPDIKILPYNFPGFSYSGFIFPPVSLSFFWTLVLICFIISFVTGFLYWAFKK